jgi:F-type H+-transporting ATPase subunit a
MMHAPDIGGMIFEHTADAHALELPFVGHVALPQWAPVHVGPVTVDLSPTKHVVFLLLAAFLVWLTMWLAGRALERQRTRGSGAPKGMASAIEAMVLFVRDDVAIANIGHNGKKFAPYILTLFWFVLYCNLLGLLPFGATATGNLAVTGALALTALLTIEISGLVALGPKGYAKTIVFVPPGTTGLTAVLLTAIMIDRKSVV